MPEMPAGPDSGEVLAKVCSFDPSTLRWEPRAQPAVGVRLVRSVSGGATRLAVGSDEAALADVREVSKLSAVFLTLHVAQLGHIGLQFTDADAARPLVDELAKKKIDYERFEQYDPSSVQSYFQYYAKLSNQQNMLQDNVRTSTYRRAIVENVTDFKGAKVMDIGAGSGILSFFAAQAGAGKVYAVEASSMADMVTALAKGNGMASTVQAIKKPLEKILPEEIPEKVDVLVSEPIGTFLFNERMIETYLCARDRFLKPGGKMFPNIGDLYIAPFSDAMLHWEQSNKNGFWKNTSFYDLDLTPAVDRCAQEHFRQPVVDYINPDCLVAKASQMRFDFTTCTVESLHNFDMPFDFEVHQPCLVHGIAGWFDALFEGSDQTINLSTAPWCLGTHWYQIRFLLPTPLAVNAGQHIVGTLKMKANNLQSYYVEISMGIKGTDVKSENLIIDLKDPEYRFYTSQHAYCPPGTPGAFGQQNAQTPGPQQQEYQKTHFQQSQQVPVVQAPECVSEAQATSQLQQSPAANGVGQSWADSATLSSPKVKSSRHCVARSRSAGRRTR